MSFIFSQDDIGFMRKVKEAWDPTGQLNPARFCPMPRNKGRSDMDIKNLEAALGAEAVLSDPDRLAKYEVDGITPQAVALPASVEEAAQAVKWANANGASLVPWGGGVLKGVGGKLKSADLVLSTERLNLITDIDPANLTVTVQAGVKFGDLQDLVSGVENRCYFPVGGGLRETADQLCSDREYKGAYVPLDPPCRDRATMGGILAANLSGPHRAAQPPDPGPGAGGALHLPPPARLSAWAARP